MCSTVNITPVQYRQHHSSAVPSHTLSTLKPHFKHHSAQPDPALASVAHAQPCPATVRSQAVVSTQPHAPAAEVVAAALQPLRMQVLCTSQLQAGCDWVIDYFPAFSKPGGLKGGTRLTPEKKQLPKTTSIVDVKTTDADVDAGMRVDVCQGPGYMWMSGTGVYVGGCSGCGCQTLAVDVTTSLGGAPPPCNVDLVMSVRVCIHHKP